MKFLVCVVLLLSVWASLVDASRARMFQEHMQAWTSAPPTSSGGLVAAMIDALRHDKQDPYSLFKASSINHPGVISVDLDSSSTTQDHHEAEGSTTSDNTDMNKDHALGLEAPTQTQNVLNTPPSTAEPQTQLVPDSVVPTEQDQDRSTDDQVPEETTTTLEQADQEPSDSQEKESRETPASTQDIQDTGDGAGASWGNRLAALIDAWRLRNQESDILFKASGIDSPGVTAVDVASPSPSPSSSSTTQDQLKDQGSAPSDSTDMDKTQASEIEVPPQASETPDMPPPTVDPQTQPLPDSVVPTEQDQELSTAKVPDVVPDETPATQQEEDQVPSESQEQDNQGSPASIQDIQDTADDAGSLQDVLDTHNSYRARFGVPPLSWSSSIAASAQSYSSNCVFEHSQTKGLGENLSLGYRNWAAAIKAWMEDEESLYDWDNPGFTHETGHLTQVIWKATTQLGCGSSPCGGRPLYVCQYSPPGNVIGGFEANVPRALSPS